MKPLTEPGRVIEFPFKRRQRVLRHRRFDPRIAARFQKQTKLIDLLALRLVDSALLDTILKMIDPADKYRGLVELIANGDIPNAAMDRIIRLIESERTSNVHAIAQQSIDAMSPAGEDLGGSEAEQKGANQ
ncbi:MAG: hypothetical protein ACREAC_09665 [Blastocatellia bacterium]